MKRRILAAATALFVLWRLALDGGPTKRWRRDERGDVPGWVMIVVLSAAIVAALIPLAGDRLTDMFEKALDSVGG